LKLSDVGFQLGIDFTNTISWRTSANPQEWLVTADGVLNWLEDKSMIDNDQRQWLERELDGAPKWRDEAIELREAGRELLLRKGDTTRNLEILNRFLARSSPRLVATEAGYTEEWSGPTGLSDVLWPVAYSFAELLGSDMLVRVNECVADGCGWLFLDVSKNRSRKWCDMSDCGNREKARRHYQKMTTAKEKRAQGS
jgi:predicted RNA-binding Zn ribbon-like protein